MPASGHEREEHHIKTGWSDSTPGLEAWMNAKKCDRVPEDNFDFKNYGFPQFITDRYGIKYQIKCKYRRESTGYGLTGEPQWSEGPPPLIEYLSPYHDIPLPPTYDINPVLVRSESELIWSIHQPPNLAKPHPDSTTFSAYHWQSRPATIPSNVGFILIHIRPLDCVVEVRARRKIITVGDVLCAIYSEARSITLQTFIRRMGGDPDLIRAVGRYLPAVTQNSGVEMGDDALSGNVSELMNYHTDWLGLSPSRTHSDVWELHTYTY